MTLKITDITLENFRSYDSFELNDLGNLTILYGPNAIGKTNVIEAIQMMTALVSFRKATSKELIKNGKEASRVSAKVTDGNRLIDLELHLGPEGREYFFNGKKRSVKDLKGFIPSIAFSPEDLSLVKGSDSNRRREIDNIGQQVNSNYYQLLHDFEKILRHRNKLLKDEAADSLLDSLTDLFDKVGNQLASYRQALLTRMTPFIIDSYSDISNGERLTIEYVSSWKDSDGLASKLDEVREQERTRRVTLVGPHRDHILLNIEGMDSTTYASQGQQRSIVLAMKIAEVQLIEEMLGQKPILLLDDVMSELDATRREAMVKELLPDTQTFITTANIEYFDPMMLDSANVIDISDYSN